MKTRTESRRTVPVKIGKVTVGGGAPVFAYTLGHGEDPHQASWERGYKVVRPLSP